VQLVVRCLGQAFSSLRAEHLEIALCLPVRASLQRFRYVPVSIDWSVDESRTGDVRPQDELGQVIDLVYSPASSGSIAERQVVTQDWFQRVK
jgi:hypothetical protein